MISLDYVRPFGGRSFRGNGAGASAAGDWRIASSKPARAVEISGILFMSGLVAFPADIGNGLPAILSVSGNGVKVVSRIPGVAGRAVDEELGFRWIGHGPIKK